ncbi:hypothetical protein HC766_06590 [Candidatus Gracilibacteria bacterium]|nr:hypothetical protein [Candidatus Gracilibacteria bacterium]
MTNNDRLSTPNFQLSTICFTCDLAPMLIGDFSWGRFKVELVGEASAKRLGQAKHIRVLPGKGLFNLFATFKNLGEPAPTALLGMVQDLSFTLLHAVSSNFNFVNRTTIHGTALQVGRCKFLTSCYTMAARVRNGKHENYL